TRKREVEENRIIRVARTYRPKPTPAESEFYNLVTQLCRDRHAASGNDVGAIFFAVMAQRQVSSSMVAVIDHWLERNPENATEGFAEATDIPPEDFDIDPESLKSEPGLWTQVGNLRKWRTRLIEHDTKFEALRTALNESPNEKVVVFAFFKKTLSYLECRLGELGVKCVRVDGDVPSVPADPERDER